MGLNVAGDLFIVAGQSQAKGFGDPAPTVPNSPARWRIWSAKEGERGIISEPASFGSFAANCPWRDFAHTWHSLTGRESVFLCMAEGASGMQVACAGAGGKYWDQRSEGENCLYTARKDWVTYAIAAMNLSPRFGAYKTYLLWDQGGNDALYINQPGASAAEYQAATEALWARFLSDFPQIDKIGVIGLGQNSTDWDNAAWLAIQAAQTAAVAAQAKAAFLYEGANLTVDKYLDNYHYTGEGNQIVGVAAATALAGML